MAKRILALVMVLVLSLSVLSVEMFAADFTVTLSEYNSTNKTLTVSWSEVSGATGNYVVTLYNGSSQVGTKSVKVTDTRSVTFTNITAGGSYTAQVTATVSSGAPQTVNSNTVVVPETSTSGKVTVESTTNGGVKVSWTAQSGATSYTVQWTCKTSANSGNEPSLIGTEYTLPSNVKYSDLVSVTVKYLDKNGNQQTLGTVTIGSGSNSSTGNVYFSGTTLYWPTNTNYYYTITCVVNDTYTESVGNTDKGVKSADMSSVITYFRSFSKYGSNAKLTFYVYGGTSARPSATSGNLIGYATYGVSSGNNNNNNGTSYGNGLSISLSGGYAKISWNPISGAYSYVIAYIQGGQGGSVEVTDTSVSLDYTKGLTVQVQYRLTANGPKMDIGYATVSANGAISYGSGSTNNGNTTSNNGTVTSNGCYLTVNSTTTYVSWDAVPGATYYQVLYAVNGSTDYSSTLATSNSVTINAGYSNCGTGFTVNVIPMANGRALNGTVLSAVFTRTASGNTGSTGTSSSNGLTLTEKNSSTTTVSWNAVNGASYYLVTYGRLDTAGYIDMPPTNKTSIDIPLGRRNGFTVTVYVVTTSGRIDRVGYATHIAGDAYSTTDSKPNNTTDTDNTSVYVTGFKGTSGDKKVTLSWNAAKGATTYEIYWKRSSASEWKKAGSTTKRSVNINGLNNGVEYDFKIVANNRDSGILSKFAPSASGSTTKTAPDPAGAGTTTSTVPVITDITGSKGTITVSWTGITGGKEYQVWIAKSGSTEYTLMKGNITGTSATITGLAAGTYKVRIKGTTDGTYKQFKDGGGSDYRSVTVS